MIWPLPHDLLWVRSPETEQWFLGMKTEEEAFLSSLLETPMPTSQKNADDTFAVPTAPFLSPPMLTSTNKVFN
jgi:hypothetical protein